MDGRLQTVLGTDRARWAETRTRGPQCCSTHSERLDAVRLLQVHVPYSYGWSIIALTALVKLVTLPLSKAQVRPRIQCLAASLRFRVSTRMPALDTSHMLTRVGF